jgi:diphthine synthase
MNAIACTGLQLYSFGETVSIPFWEENWQPTSFFDKILSNLKNGLHTLCLLDIKVKEKSVQAMMRGKDEYEKPRFMSASVAAQQLLSILSQRDETLITKSSIVAAVARVGSEDQKIVSCTLEEMANTDLGSPLHSLVIPGKMHPLEEEMLATFRSSVIITETNGQKSE